MENYREAIKSSIKRERFRCERSSSQVRSKDMVGDFRYLKPMYKVENLELGGIPVISNLCDNMKAFQEFITNDFRIINRQPDL